MCLFMLTKKTTLCSTIDRKEIKFRAKIFVVTEFVKTCHELVIGLDHDKMPQLSDDHEISGSEFR